jgi:UDP-2,4-diacetamido-2,4,6-trideoxy-beta-L-altropyranose hydrolase
MALKIAVRVDASVHIGVGHVMRCLTLADSLQRQGAEVSFICRAHKGNLIQYIKDKGYIVYPLEFSDKVFSGDGSGTLAHMNWLGTTQNNDAKDCQSAMEALCPDWLIVDHYALDFRWHNQFKEKYKKLMVIDDLADRKHDCDLLLDQTFGRKEKDYVGFVPHGCKLLLGTNYALLRPEFPQWREYSLQRRVKSELKNIIISMGGIDQNNLTGQVLEVLKTCTLPQEVTITVILGAATPNIDMVKLLAVTMPYVTNVKVNVENMAELMTNADLAIGAAGSTTWERCCLGLPSIQLVVAVNQMLIAKNLREACVIEYIENLSDLPVKLNETVKKFKKLSLLSSMVTDGDGSKKVCDYMISNVSIDEMITLKPISINDCEYVYSLQTTESRKFSINPVKPSWAEHIEWFEKTIYEYSSVLFIIMLGQLPTGFIKFDNINGKDINVSIIIDSKYSGRGIAKKSLSQFIKLQPGRYFKATIHKENIPSQKVFENIGFAKLGESGDFFQYAMLNG